MSTLMPFLPLVRTFVLAVAIAPILGTAPDRTTESAAAAMAVVTAGESARVPPPSPFPDSSSGRCADAWFALVNALAAGSATADVAAASIRSFEDSYASATRLASVSMEERVSRVMKLGEEFGSITPIAIESHTDALLAIDGVSAKRGEATIEFRFDGKGKLDSIAIATGDGVRSQPLSPARRAAAIDAACEAVTNAYVFPEKGKAMAAALRAAVASGSYENVTDEATFVQCLTKDLHSVTNDKHLRVRIAPNAPSTSAPNRDEPVVRADLEEFRRSNWGFQSVEILDGNVGVLRFDHFADDAEARAVADSAMAFLARCDAIVFDLRANGGGSPTMICHLTSYLFDTPTLLNRMIDRNGEVVREAFTAATVPGVRFRADLPVFVVTSGRTFSGAEEFAYNLKNLKRATIVGETTGGGAHPVKLMRLDDRLEIRMPHLRAENPITKTNWEGVGVTPDVSVSADQALDRAVELARERIGRR